MKYTTSVKGIKSDDTIHEPSTDETSRVEKVRGYMEVIELNLDGLNEKQYEFIADMQKKLETYGDRSKFTDGQYGWIKGIWEDILEAEEDGREFGASKKSRRRRR